VVNLSILGFFKYLNFFSSNLTALVGYFGLTIHPVMLKIALPVGISFYTFRTMSYTFDVYTGKMEPTRNYLDYALFVSFFPLLVAGPIMRAGDLLPQIAAPRKLRLAWFFEGCHLIFWGLFQKVFVADNLAKIVDPVFGASPPYGGYRVLIAMYAFAFQIYCDFAGYSNIARGLGKCMGFDIMVNFNLPFFATNPQDFWKRWHISLSTWLRDYLYIPIAFSKRNWGNMGMVFAFMITFILCGLWHGAGWTFLIWGAYQGLLLVIYSLFKPLLNKKAASENVLVNKVFLIIRILFLFHLISFGWLIFRAQSMEQAFNMLKSIFLNFDYTYILPALGLAFFTSIVVVVELMQYVNNNLTITLRRNIFARAVFYAVCFWLLITLGVRSSREFLYLQF